MSFFRMEIQLSKTQIIFVGSKILYVFLSIFFYF